MSDCFWDLPKTIQENLTKVGVDYDLAACLGYNPQNFGMTEIKQVVAVIEGQNDGESWQWVLELTTGKFAYLTGWCDYTGWDCQSGASSTLYDNPVAACGDNADLLSQVNSKKNLTWHEKMDIEFGVAKIQKIYPKIEVDEL